MKNNEQYIIIVRYPEWEQTFGGETHKYSAFGVKYLFDTGIHQFPEWEEDDERWLRYDPLDTIKSEFIEWYVANISADFKGEILFIEPVDIVIAKHKV